MKFSELVPSKLTNSIGGNKVYWKKLMSLTCAEANAFFEKLSETQLSMLDDFTQGWKTCYVGQLPSWVRRGINFEPVYKGLAVHGTAWTEFYSAFLADPVEENWRTLVRESEKIEALLPYVKLIHLDELEEEVKGKMEKTEEIQSRIEILLKQLDAEKGLLNNTKSIIDNLNLQIKRLK